MGLDRIWWPDSMRSLKFNLMFWTPFWLVPWAIFPFEMVPGRPDARTVMIVYLLSRAVAGLAVSAGLAAIGEICGPYRRYYFAVVGTVCWFGSEIWLLFLFASSNTVNAYTMATAAQYLFGNGNDVNISLWIVLPMVAVTVPFVPLVRFWKALDWPGSRHLIIGGTVIALSLIPADLIRAYWVFGADFVDQNRPVYRADIFIPLEVYFRIPAYLSLHREMMNFLAKAPLLVSHERAPMTLIVLVGESTPRRHMSLYGYCRNTTPGLLARANELFVLDNMISTLPLTTLALPKVFRVPDVPTRSGPASSTLFTILNESGFNTYWISNQYQYDSPADVITTLVELTGHQVWARRYNEVTRDYSQDAELLPYLQRTMAKPERDKAIFLHLMGAHYVYSTRYPKDFKHPSWSALTGMRDATTRSLIDDFDTAILYQDSVLSAAIDMARKSNGNVALVYFSDHGEEVFDQYPLAGHTYPSATRTMLEIPTVIWLSPALKRSRPELSAALNAVRHVRLQLSDIAPLVLDLAEIRTVGDALPHPLRPNFRTDPRIVDHQDYDVDPDLGRTPQLPPLCPVVVPKPAHTQHAG